MKKYLAAGLALGLSTAFIPRELKSRYALALHVLKGNPLAYRIDLEDGVLTIRRPNTIIAEITVTHNPREVYNVLVS